MDTVVRQVGPALDEETELLAIAARLQALAKDLIERSNIPGPDAFDLLARGTGLQRAAFVIASGLVADLRVA